MIIKLQILASDIREGDYFNSKDCPITRALDRAGYPHIADSGLVLRDLSYNTINSSNHMELSERVVKMYRWIENQGTGEEIEEPQDFEFDLNLDYEINKN